MTFEEWWKQYIAAGGKTHFNIRADEESARAAWDAARKAEFICSKCGLRKDSEHSKGDF